MSYYCSSDSLVCKDYLELNPENASFKDLFHLLFFNDRKNFIVSPSEFEQDLRKYNYRWLVVTSVVMLKLFRIMKKPMKYIGYFIIAWMNLITNYGGVLKLFLNFIKAYQEQFGIIHVMKVGIGMRANRWSLVESGIWHQNDYLNPFHAYDEGNLSWLAAAEADPATMSITRRVIPDAVSLDETIEIVRGNWLRVIEQHHLEYSGDSVVAGILDIGCSVGWSTRFLANKFPSANVTGLDLSPYFLAVAQYKEKKGSSSGKCIKWVHANGEDTGLPANSFDIVSIAYVYTVKNFQFALTVEPENAKIV